MATALMDSQSSNTLTAGFTQGAGINLSHTNSPTNVYFQYALSLTLRIVAGDSKNGFMYLVALTTHILKAALLKMSCTPMVLH
jgi:hypothetical protein